MTERDYAAKLRAPFATLGIRTGGGAVIGVRYLPRGERAMRARDEVAALAAAEIEHYLHDPSFRFTVPLAADGTPFQHRVWDTIATIPIAESRTYAEVARTVRSSARAVGGACGRNPIALIVPCHRVVGSRGALGGFMSARDGEGQAIKRWLLAHEGYRFGA